MVDPVEIKPGCESILLDSLKGLAVLILMIATANLFNRLHVTIRQVAGSQSW